MIGEDDGSVALGNASHRHMENAVRSLDVMLLQAEETGANSVTHDGANNTDAQRPESNVASEERPRRENLQEIRSCSCC